METSLSNTKNGENESRGQVIKRFVEIMVGQSAPVDCNDWTTSMNDCRKTNGAIDYNRFETRLGKCLTHTINIQKR